MSPLSTDDIPDRRRRGGIALETVVDAVARRLITIPLIGVEEAAAAVSIGAGQRLELRKHDALSDHLPLAPVTPAGAWPASPPAQHRASAGSDRRRRRSAEHVPRRAGVVGNCGDRATSRSSSISRSTRSPKAKLRFALRRSPAIDDPHRHPFVVRLQCCSDAVRPGALRRFAVVLRTVALSCWPLRGRPRWRSSGAADASPASPLRACIAHDGSDSRASVTVSPAGSYARSSRTLHWRTRRCSHPDARRDRGRRARRCAGTH